MPKPPELASLNSLSKLSSSSRPDAVLSAMPASSGGKSGGAGTAGNSMSMGPKGMTIQSGKDTLSLSAGKLSIKSGNTSFDIQSLADGIKMQASNSDSKKTSSFQMNSKGTTQIHEGPKSYSKVVNRTDAFKHLAQGASDNLWNTGRQASSTHRSGGSFDDSIFESSSRSSKGLSGPRSRSNSI